jgi:hypothetical protein
MLVAGEGPCGANLLEGHCAQAALAATTASRQANSPEASVQRRVRVVWFMG